MNKPNCETIIVIVIIIIIIIILVLLYTKPNIELFDLGVDLRQLPYYGYYGGYYGTTEIGRTMTSSTCECKDKCNKLASCKGITYDPSTRICRLYNDTSVLIYDPNKSTTLSWKQFGHKIY